MTAEMQYMNGGGDNLDLYFAGSSHNLSSQWINELNLNRLFSQELNRTEIARMVEMKKNGQYTGKILIDSGAFTAHTQGIEVDVDEYISYLNSITEQVNVFAQVDKIPGQFGKPKTDEDLLEAPKLSWENYLYMRPKLKEPEKLMPIYHQGEKLEWLKNMLEWTDEHGNHIPYIGISPANDKAQSEKDKFIDMCFDTIKRSSNPNVKTHAFGMTNLKTLTEYPFTSSDSTTWVMTPVNGGIMTKMGVVGISAQSKSSTSINNKTPDQIAALSRYIHECGFELEDMREAPIETVIKRIQAKVDIDTEKCRAVLEGKAKPDSEALKEAIKFEKGRSISGKTEYKAYLERIRWNIHYLARWSKEYQYKPKAFKKPNLLRGRM